MIANSQAYAWLFCCYETANRQQFLQAGALPHCSIAADGMEGKGERARSYGVKDLLFGIAAVFSVVEAP